MTGFCTKNLPFGRLFKLQLVKFASQNLKLMTLTPTPGPFAYDKDKTKSVFYFGWRDKQRQTRDLCNQIFWV